MEGSRERVRRVLAFEKPDRPAVFDLLPNDAILQHFNGGNPVAIGDDAGAIRAIREATDGTRQTGFSPMKPGIEQLDNGREQKYERWSIWTSHREFSSSEEYSQVKGRETAEGRKSLESAERTEEGGHYKNQLRLYQLFGEDTASFSMWDHRD